MSSSGSGRGSDGEPSSPLGPPPNLPSIPAPPPSGMDDRFILQLLVELQRASVEQSSKLAELATKTDRLIKDVESQSGKLDAVRQQISFVKGAVWVVGALVAFAVAARGIYLRLASSIDHSAPVAERPRVSSPVQRP